MSDSIFPDHSSSNANPSANATTNANRESDAAQHEQFSAIPPELLERVPLMRPEWMRNYLRLIEHAAAPRWTNHCGDRLQSDDLPVLREFETSLARFHESSANQTANQDFATTAPDASPPPNIIDWIQSQATDCIAIRERFAEADAAVRTEFNRPFDLARDFARLRPMTRADFARKLETIVPQSADLARLVVNPTSGTTGQPIPAPNHPAAVGCYDVLIAMALRLNDVQPDYAAPDQVAAVQICAQRRTMTYATVHAFLNGAGFAKINLNASDWRAADDPRAYLTELRPFFLTGDPYAFNALLEWLEARRLPGQGIFGDTDYRPRALYSTALTLSAGLRERLSAAFGCPVIDVYSLNETGPVAVSVPEKSGRLIQLPPDIYIEALDPGTGRPVPDGEAGEIAITGGRNPYLPLLRYRTGDTGRVYHSRDGRAEIELLFAREPVIFTRPDGAVVNPVDIARVLREFQVIQFQFRQLAAHDAGYVLYLQISEAQRVFPETQLRDRFVELFGPEARLRIEYTEDWSDARYDAPPNDDDETRFAHQQHRKVLPFVRENKST